MASMSVPIPGFVIVSEDGGEDGEATVHMAVTDKTGIQKLMTLSEVSSMQEELPTGSSPPEANKGNSGAAKAQFQCKHCVKSFATMKSLKRHKKQSHPDVPDDCDDVLADADDGSKEQCILVQDLIASETPQTHSRLLVKDLTLANSLAEELKVLTRVSTRRKRKYEGVKEHQCDLCQKRFATPSLLKRHSVVHTGEKPFQCQLCGNKYSQAERLRRHMGTHTGLNIFKCKVCEKQFEEKCRYIDHVRSHLEEKPFQCDICRKVFMSRVGLWKHKSIHSGDGKYYGESCAAYRFKCETCSKQFRLKQELERHTRKHTGEAPAKLFDCQFCEKKFSRKILLETHIRSHTGERPFLCQYCLKRFACKRARACHVKLHALGKAAQVIRAGSPLETACLTTQDTFPPDKSSQCHCRDCDQYFQKKGSFIQHLKDKHNISFKDDANTGPTCSTFTFQTSQDGSLVDFTGGQQQSVMQGFTQAETVADASRFQPVQNLPSYTTVSQSTNSFAVPAGASSAIPSVSYVLTDSTEPLTQSNVLHVPQTDVSSSTMSSVGLQTGFCPSVGGRSEYSIQFASTVPQSSESSDPLQKQECVPQEFREITAEQFETLQAWFPNIGSLQSSSKDGVAGALGQHVVLCLAPDGESTQAVQHQTVEASGVMGSVGHGTGQTLPQQLMDNFAFDSTQGFPHQTEDGAHKPAAQTLPPQQIRKVQPVIKKGGQESQEDVQQECVVNMTAMLGNAASETEQSELQQIRKVQPVMRHGGHQEGVPQQHVNMTAVLENVEPETEQNVLQQIGNMLTVMGSVSQESEKPVSQLVESVAHVMQPPGTLMLQQLENTVNVIQRHEQLTSQQVKNVPNVMAFGSVTPGLPVSQQMGTVIRSTPQTTQTMTSPYFGENPSALPQHSALDTVEIKQQVTTELTTPHQLYQAGLTSPETQTSPTNSSMSNGNSAGLGTISGQTVMQTTTATQMMLPVTQTAAAHAPASQSVTQNTQTLHDFRTVHPQIETPPVPVSSTVASHGGLSGLGSQIHVPEGSDQSYSSLIPQPVEMIQNAHQTTPQDDDYGEAGDVHGEGNVHPAQAHRIEGKGSGGDVSEMETMSGLVSANNHQREEESEQQTTPAFGIQEPLNRNGATTVPDPSTTTPESSHADVGSSKQRIKLREMEQQIRESLENSDDYPDRSNSFAPVQLLEEFMPKRRTRRKSV